MDQDHWFRAAKMRPGPHSGNTDVPTFGGIMFHENIAPAHFVASAERNRLARAIAALGIVMTAALVACSDGAQPIAPTSKPTVALSKGEFDGPKSVPTRGRLLFSSALTGEYDLFSAYEDGTGLVRLTTSPASDITGAYSPDGRKVAFLSTRDGSFQLYVMNADGSSIKRLTNLEPFSWHVTPPSWSPDGKKIAFSGTASDPTKGTELYVIGANGTGLTPVASHASDDAAPQFSPDGKRIAFTSDRSGYDEVWIVNADGTDAVQLTECNGAYCRNPSWSPDGTLMAFSVGFGTEVRIVPVATPNVTVTTIPLAENPVWAPDGVKLAVTSTATNPPHPMIVNMDGSAPYSLSIFGTPEARPTSWTAR